MEFSTHNEKAGILLIPGQLSKNHRATIEHQFSLQVTAHVGEPPQAGREAARPGMHQYHDIVRAHKKVGGLARCIVGCTEAGSLGKNIHLSHKVHHEWTSRMVVNLSRAADLLDTTLIHHNNLVGNFHRLLLVVSHDHCGDVHLIVEVAEPGPELLAHLRVESTEGFIKKQHLGLNSQGSGERNTLTLPTRELGGITVTVALQLNQIKQFINPILDLILLPFTKFKPEADVLANVAVLKKGKVLEDKAHMPFLNRAFSGLLTTDPNPAMIGLIEACDHAQQRALP